MIGQLRGTVADRKAGMVVLDVAGVGYLLRVTPETSASLPESDPVLLYTHLAVRENALDLYGFPSVGDLEFFEMLITVSGIGPKSALNILSLANVETLTSAIASGDVAYLTKVSGIGRKSAEKMVLELKDKVGSIDTSIRSGGSDGDLIEALVGLGYSQKEARDVVKGLPASAESTQERLKEALRTLGAK